MSYQFSDEGIFSITKILYNQFLSQKNMKRLDIDKVDQFKQLHIKPLYPHKENIKNGRKILQKYQCQQYCCNFSPGRFCCCNTTAPDPEYREFGLGVCLYTKFMKHLAGFLFFVSILSIISIAVYELAAYQTGIKITQSYHNTLFSTSIGVLSSQFVKCNYVQIKQNTAFFDLKCSTGQVNLIKPVFSNNTLSNLLNCREENMKADQGVYLANYVNLSVDSNSSSQIKLNISIDTNIYNDYTYKYLAFNYECINSKYTFTTLSSPSANLVLLTIGIDLVIIACFILFMISEHNAQKKQIQYFKMKELAVHDFTVKIGGFRLAQYEDDLKLFVQQYDRVRTSSMVQGGVNGFINNIVQIKIPEVEELKEASQSRKQYYDKLYDLVDNCFFDDGIDIYRYRDCQDFIKKCYGTNQSPQYKQYKKRLTKLVYAFLQSKKVKFIDNQIQMNILMVLTNPKDKKLMLHNAKNGCFSHYLKLKGRQFSVSEPPIADMVIWENKSKYTCLRVILAWLITLIICFGSYLLVAFATFKKQQSLNNNNFNIDCTFFYNTSQLQTWQQSLYNTNVTSNDGKYMNCYCDYNYFSWSYKDSDMRTKCSKWFGQYFIYSAIPILISLGIVIYNMIIDRIFRILTKFQGHDNLSTELYSYIVKRSFILIMNMGLIIILIKLNYRATINISDLSFLFQGTYNDITSDWYLQIGVIIMLTLAFNIIIPIFDMIFVSFLKCLRKCIDRQCFCVKTSKRTKKQFVQLYADDVFPIQSRYSDFIALIVISLAFSAIMPLLYIIAFLSIWFMFICDKLLLFRVYQKPINYSQDLQNKVFKLVYIAIMIHCVVSVFTLSEKHLMSAGANKQNISRFGIIITTSYLIPYVGIFLLMAAWAVLDSTIISCLQYCVRKCTKQVSKIYRSKLHQNFYAALNTYQTTKLKMSLQMQLHNNVEHQKTGKQSMTRIICQNSLMKINDLEKIRNIHGNNLSSAQQNVKLIGKAGYDQTFDDQIFNREKKIKSIDYQFQDIIKIQRTIRKNKAGPIQQTTMEINL